jgi:hypothetical protein
VVHTGKPCRDCGASRLEALGGLMTRRLTGSSRSGRLFGIVPRDVARKGNSTSATIHGGDGRKQVRRPRYRRSSLDGRDARQSPARLRVSLGVPQIRSCSVKCCWLSLTESQSLFGNRQRVEQEIRLLRVSVGIAPLKGKYFLVSVPGGHRPADQAGVCVLPAVADWGLAGFQQK